VTGNEKWLKRPGRDDRETKEFRPVEEGGKKISFPLNKKKKKKRKKKKKP